MKTAIVYYSLSGNTGYAAEKISEELGADLISVDPVKAYPDTGFKKFLLGGKGALMAEAPKLKPYTFEGDRYERVIFGFPLWAGSITPPIRSFIQENKAALTGKRFALFICCSGGSTEKAAEKLRELLGVNAFDASISLVDPKKHPDSAESPIHSFCETLKQG